MATAGQRAEQEIHHDRAENQYNDWPAPECIVSDGPYGLAAYEGDAHSCTALAPWYLPHVQAWAQSATTRTTLWFWSSEIGWATVHPIIERAGFDYRGLIVWDKGPGHIAGNVNSKTLTRLPVVSEVCAHYTRRETVGAMTMKQWLRCEWRRTGLALNQADAACATRSAATRKYLTTDEKWYRPPGEAFEHLVAYANTEGSESGRPYFAEDGAKPMTRAEYEHRRPIFHCPGQGTNVWRIAHTAGAERVRTNGRSVHAAQKPIALFERLIAMSTNAGDTVWEPFGGLCPGAVAAMRLNRRCESAEPIERWHREAVKRLAHEQHR